MQVLVCYGLKASAENGKASFLFSNDGSHIFSNLHNQTRCELRALWRQPAGKWYVVSTKV